MRRLRLLPVAAGLFAGGAFAATDSVYPTKPIRMLASGVGGGGDFAARVIAQGLIASWGQQVVVDNRPAGVIPGQIVANAAPDGYTLLVTGSILWIGTFMYNNVPYDPVRDFVPVTLAVSSPSVLVVPSTVNANSVGDLIKLARSKPGEFNYATAGTGSSMHLAGELFKAMAGVHIVRVNYKGGGAALNDLLSSQVQIAFGSVASVSPHVKTGRLKALAVTSLRPSALFPELPTIAASGVPGYESVVTSGIFAPAKTPGAVVQRLNKEIIRVLALPDVKDKFFNSGVETVGTTPEEFASRIRAEMARLGKVIREAGIRAE